MTLGLTPAPVPLVLSDASEMLILPSQLHSSMHDTLAREWQYFGVELTIFLWFRFWGWGKVNKVAFRRHHSERYLFHFPERKIASVTRWPLRGKDLHIQDVAYPHQDYQRLISIANFRYTSCVL